MKKLLLSFIATFSILGASVASAEQLLCPSVESIRALTPNIFMSSTDEGETTFWAQSFTTIQVGNQVWSAGVGPFQTEALVKAKAAQAYQSAVATTLYADYDEDFGDYSCTYHTAIPGVSIDAVNDFRFIAARHSH